ncbi:Dihydropyrimidinase-related protein 3-like [Lasiodiplodia theobromae]|uniref:Dihydropyrimidinase-related protein 3-like n=1 Tax=Lasiodiplodia theobromae TaxID=45133 RepID=UPI0015C2D45E|nr:Dihydropyrimidinase-related protein 3-like [Lasiodiplodia theobromae]KAF4544411.1 Dihydropyrimidinase-related protein 3-like [Lasiodiplodia theobromae]
MSVVTFNKDTVKLKDPPPNISDIDFYVPDGDAITQKSTALLDGRSTESENFKVTKGEDFPDYVEVTIRGPTKENEQHVIKASASDGTTTPNGGPPFTATWTKV